jgi:hypothetical protein
MPDPNAPSRPGASDQSKDEELVRLRAEVSALRDELARLASPRRDARAGGDYYAEAADAREDERENFGGRTSDREDETEDIVRDLTSRAADEANKLIRGLAFAYLEQLRLSANVVTTIAEEVFRRNRPGGTGRGARSRRRRDDERESARDRASMRERYADERDEYEGEREHEGRARRRRTAAGLAGDLPGDLYTGILKAVDQSLRIPGRTIERFYESFRETEEAELTSRRRRDEDRLERPAPGSERRASEAEREFDRAQEDASRATREAARATLEALKPEP